MNFRTLSICLAVSLGLWGLGVWAVWEAL